MLKKPFGAVLSMPPYPLEFLAASVLGRPTLKKSAGPADISLV